MNPFRAGRRRHEGHDQVRDALDDGKAISLLLCLEGELSREAAVLVARASELGIKIRRESERGMRRMSTGERGEEVIALEGPDTSLTIDELMSAEGLVFVLVGLRYPGNVGFILRSAEVAGAAGVVVDPHWRGGEMTEALRIGMHADRFFPVIEESAAVAVAAARRAQRRILALETTGDGMLWQADLCVPSLIVVGSETTGIEQKILDQADEILRIPTRGFIPSYNVQAAVSMVLGEWMRQGS